MVSRDYVISLILSIRQAGGRITETETGIALEMPNGPDADRLRTEFLRHSKSIDQLRSKMTLPLESAVPVPGTYPVHPCQDGLWYHKLVRPGSSTNCTHAYLVIGKIDIGWLADAYQGVLGSYDALRLKPAAGVSSASRSWRLSPTPRVEVRVMATFSEMLGSDVVKDVSAWDMCERLANEVFDIDRGPLGAVSIFPTVDGCLVLEAFEHMIVDGRSLSLLHEELQSVFSGTQYTGTRGCCHDLYLRFLTKGEKKSSVDFWETMFIGFEVSPSNDEGQEPRLWETDLCSGTVKRLEEKGREIGASLATMGFAAHSHAIARGISTSDVCSFVAQDLRGADEQYMFGHSTQLLPVRVMHDWEKTIKEHCRDTAILLARARENGWVGQEALRLAGAPVTLTDMSTNAFVFQEQQVMPPQFAGVTANSISLGSHYSAGGVTTVMRRLKNGGIQIETRSRNPEHSTNLGRLIHSTIVSFLHAVLSSDGMRLGDTNLLSVECREVVQACATPAPVLGDLDLAAGIMENLRVKQTEPALVENDQPISRGHLLDAAKNIEKSLASLGIGRGQAILVCETSSFRQVAAYLGVMSCGAIYVPAPRNSELSMIHGIANRSGATAMVLEGSVNAFEPKNSFGELSRRRGWNPDEAAYVIFTSGSSGTPKGVVIRRSSINNFAECELLRFNLDDRSRVLLIAPQEVDPWIAHVSGTLLANGTLVAADPTKGDISRTIEKHNVTHAFLPAAMLGTLDPERITNLRMLASAGDHYNSDAMRRIRGHVPRLFNIYGPTEATISALVHEVTDDTEPVPIGKPVSGLGASILIDGQAHALPGAAGELCLSGPAVGMGYLDKDVNGVADVFSTNEFGLPSYKTGDLAKLGIDGLICIEGRLDRQVKIRGFRVELDGIERAALASGQCSHARAVKVPLGSSHKIALAYCGEIEPKEIRSLLLTSMPAQVAPELIEQVSEIPLTEAGKPNDRAVRAYFKRVSGRCEWEATNPEAAALTAAWSKVFKKQPRRDDDFFSAGGDSLSALTFVRELRDRGFDVKPSDIYRFSSIENLAQWMLQCRSNEVDHDSHLFAPTAPRLPSHAWFDNLDVDEKKRWIQRIVIELDAPVSPDEMQKALDELLAQTPVLRACYDRRGFHATQSLGTQGILQALDGDAADADIAVALQNAHLQLDPTTGQVLAAVLVNRRVLVLVGHHLAVDDWSWNIIQKRLKRILQSQNYGHVSIDTGAFRHAVWISALRRSGGLCLDEKCWRALLDCGVTASIGDAQLKDEFINGDLCVKLDELMEAHGLSRSSILLGLTAGALNEIEPKSKSVVDLETNGRAIQSEADLYRAVGWIGTHHPFVLRHAPFSIASCKQIEHDLAIIPDQGLGYMVSRWIDRTLNDDRLGRIAINISEFGHTLRRNSALAERVAGNLPEPGAINMTGHHASLTYRISEASVRFEMRYVSAYLPGAPSICKYLSSQSSLEPEVCSFASQVACDVSPFLEPFPVSAMQNLMLNAARLGPDVYRPKAIFSLHALGGIEDTCDRLSRALGAYPPFRLRFRVGVDGYKSQWMANADPVELALVEGGPETVRSWFENSDALSADDVLRGCAPVAGQIVHNGGADPTLCLQFHHAVLDGHSRNELESLIKKANGGRENIGKVFAAAKALHAIRRNVAAEMQADTHGSILPDHNIKLAFEDYGFALNTVTVPANTVERIVERGAAAGACLKAVVGAAILTWAAQTATDLDVWFVVNGRDPDLPGVASGPGLFWSFLRVRASLTDLQKNLEISQQATRVDFSKIRRRANEILHPEDGISFNFLAPDQAQQNKEETTLVMSRDRFHFSRQIRVRRRSDGALTIDLEFQNTVKADELRQCAKQIEGALIEFGEGPKHKMPNWHHV